jgi:hypothetical protein
VSLFDWDQVATDLAAVRGENEEDIVIRRGNTTLDAQGVRVARLSRGRIHTGDGSRESRGGVVVMGGSDLDIRPDDRFTDANGVLYRVVIVRPNRRAAVMAEAQVIE